MSSGNFSMLVPLRLSECTLFPVHFPNRHSEFPTETQTQTKPTQVHTCDDHRITWKCRNHAIYGCSVQRVGRHVEILYKGKLQDEVADEIDVLALNAGARNAQNLDFGDLTVCEKNSYYAMQRRATSHAPVSEVNMETTPLHPRAGLKEMSSFSIEGNLHISSWSTGTWWGCRLLRLMLMLVTELQEAEGKSFRMKHEFKRQRKAYHQACTSYQPGCW